MTKLTLPERGYRASTHPPSENRPDLLRGDGLTVTVVSALPRYRVDAIPVELKALDRWVAFQITRGSDGKVKKLPLIAGVPGKHLADISNLATWRPFEVALVDAEMRGLFLAFAFDRSIPYFFIDADGVVQPDGSIRLDVVLLRDTLDTYTEWSVHGVGLHLVGKGAFPELCANRAVPPGCSPLERYPLSGGRFCIFTGNVLPGFETVEECDDELAALFPPRSRAANGSTASAGYRGPAGDLTNDEIESIIEWTAPFWTDGRRHHMALHLSGYLGKQRISREQAVAIIKRCAADDSDRGSRITACHDTYDNLEAGADVSGWHGLLDICGLSRDDLDLLASILNRFCHRSRPRIPRVNRAPRLRAREVRHA